MIWRETSQPPLMQPKPPQRNPLAPGPSERAIVCGQTGSGKSTLCRVLLESSEKQLVMIDPKADFQPPSSVAGKGECCIVHSPTLAVRHIQRGDHVLYRPTPQWFHIAAYDEVLQAIYEQGELQGYDDELAMTVESPMKFPRYLQAIYQQGRGKGIAWIGVSQRPCLIPGFCMSECENTYVFRLKQMQDQQRAAHFLGMRYWRRPANDHGFWFRHDLDDGIDDTGSSSYVLTGI